MNDRHVVNVEMRGSVNGVEGVEEGAADEAEAADGIEEGMDDAVEIAATSVDNPVLQPRAY